MCKHSSILPEDQCAVCKDWPSFDRMKTKFPELSFGAFMVMEPEQRVAAMKRGGELPK